jgi:hypothetical protein
MAQDMPVPVKLQAAIFKKVLGFDKTLQSAGGYEILVAFGESSGPAKDEAVEAFKAMGVVVKAVAVGQLAGALTSSTVIYVAQGALPPKLLAGKGSTLWISGMTALVEKGQVAVGLDIDSGKPKIVIHAAQLKAEGHEFSADLLSIAKILQ